MPWQALIIAGIGAVATIAAAFIGGSGGGPSAPAQAPVVAVTSVTFVHSSLYVQGTAMGVPEGTLVVALAYPGRPPVRPHAPSGSAAAGSSAAPLPAAWYPGRTVPDAEGRPALVKWHSTISLPRGMTVAGVSVRAVLTQTSFGGSAAAPSATSQSGGSPGGATPPTGNQDGTPTSTGRQAEAPPPTLNVGGGTCALGDCGPAFYTDVLEAAAHDPYGLKGSPIKYYGR
jgi:hypothetical protein